MQDSNISLILISDSMSTGDAINLVKKNEIQDEEVCTFMLTPTQFIETTQGLTMDQANVVSSIGFGELHHLGCSTIFDTVCEMMLNSIDPLNEIVLIHGKEIPFGPTDFALVMGIKDGGLDIQKMRDTNESLVRLIRKQLGGGEGGLHIVSLKKCIMESTRADEIFKIAYVLYAVACILCPNGTNVVDQSLISTLVETNMIKDLNWATFCYYKMQESVISMQSKGFRNQAICVLFLQNFYFDVVDNESRWVDKGITPITAWNSTLVNKLIRWVEQNGGLTNTNQNVWRRQPIIHEKESDPNGKIYDAKQILLSVEGLHKRVSNMKQKESRLTESMERMERMLGSFQGATIKHIVGEVLARLEQRDEGKHGECQDQFKFRADLNVHEFRGSEAQSNDPSRLLKGKNICMNPLPDEVCMARKMNPPLKVQSKCSFSPDGAPKPAKRSIKEKKLRSVGVQSMHIRKALFKTRGRTYGKKTRVELKDDEKQEEQGLRCLFNVKANTPKEDIELLTFIGFSKKPLTNLQLRYYNVTVAKHGGVIVSRADMQCLLPGQLLSDYVINMFASYLNEDGVGDWYFPTYFGASSNVKNIQMTRMEWIEHTCRVSMLDRFKGKFRMCRRIYIPLRDPASEGHWYLLVVHKDSRFGEIVDSAPDDDRTSFREEVARMAMKMLDNVFGDDIREEMGVLPHFTDLPFMDMNNHPVQRNSFYCGVFVIRNMQHYGTQWNEDYVSDEHRANLVLECVNHPRNEVVNVREMVADYLSQRVGDAVDGMCSTRVGEARHMMNSGGMTMDVDPMDERRGYLGNGNKHEFCNLCSSCTSDLQ